MHDFEKIVYEQTIRPGGKENDLRKATLKIIHKNILQHMKRNGTIDLIYLPDHLYFFNLAASFFQVFFIIGGLLSTFSAGYLAIELSLILLPASFFIIQIAWIPPRLTTAGLKYLALKDPAGQKKWNAVMDEPPAAGWM